MFWKKKEPCFHDWKVSDFHVSYSFMADIDNYYDLTCTKCKKSRTVEEHEYHQMKDKGFINK